MSRGVVWLAVLCLGVIAAPSAWAAPQGQRGQPTSGAESSIGKPTPEKKPVQDKTAQDKPAADKGWLGVETRNLTPEDIAGAAGSGPLHGVKVVRIAEGSPAVGNLTHGDVLVSVDGKDVDSAKTFFGILAGKPPGREIRLGVSRSGRKRVVTLKLGVRPGDRLAAKPAAAESATAQSVQGQSGQAQPAQASVAKDGAKDGDKDGDLARPRVPGVAFMTAGGLETSQTAPGQEAAAVAETAERQPQTEAPTETGLAQLAPVAEADTAPSAQEAPEAKPGEAAETESSPSGAATPQAAAEAESAVDVSGKPAVPSSLELTAGAGASSGGIDERKFAANDPDAPPSAVRPAYPDASGYQNSQGGGDAFRLAAREPGGNPMQETICEGLPVSVGAGAPGETRCITPGKGAAADQSFRDCPVCPAMVVAPPGTFIMGSPKEELGDRSSGEPEHNKREDPQHLVTIPYAFAVGKFSVTFEEWDACHADGACGDKPPSDKGWGRGRRPVIHVSWADAKAYIRWLSKKTGREYRLLSEAEREYVTRAGGNTPYWWGAAASTDKANFSYDQNVSGEYKFDGEENGKYRDQTLLVDDLQPNPWGLHHVHGNVAEWVEDCWHDSYKNKPEELKKTGGPWKVGDCFYRVKRGGGYDSNRIYLRSASRSYDEFDSQEANTGFRVARSLAP